MAKHSIHLKLTCGHWLNDLKREEANPIRRGAEVRCAVCGADVVATGEMRLRGLTTAQTERLLHKPAKPDVAPPHRRKDGLTIHELNGKTKWWCRFCDGSPSKHRRREVRDRAEMWEQWDAHKVTRMHAEAADAQRQRRADEAVASRVTHSLEDRSSSGE